MENQANQENLQNQANNENQPGNENKADDKKLENTQNIDFEKYKFKAELWKWAIGTAGVSFITLIINWGFTDRKQGMEEILQYDKYATVLIVLNNNPVKKRMLAQFFANVTPSDNLKCGWEEYYKEVDEEYTKLIKTVDSTKKELQLMKINKERFEKDTNNIKNNTDTL